MADDGAVAFVFYHYKPSIVAAVIFTIVFFLLMFMHFYQLLRTRTWFMIPFVLGGLGKQHPSPQTHPYNNTTNTYPTAEAIGYIGRVMSSLEAPDYTTNPYIIQSILLLIAPALLAASIYMTLGRIILLTEGEHHSILRLKWLTKVFVAGDVISFFAQGGGGGIMAQGGTEASRKTGQYVIIGGLIVQVVFFGMFIITATIFHSRMLKNPTEVVRGVRYIPWKEHLLALYLGSMFILVRSVFRVIEYSMGQDGYLMSHEWCLYIFDALLMSLTMIIFVWKHPSEINALLRRGRGKAMVNMVQVHTLA
jgi:hypothetical protein